MVLVLAPPVIEVSLDFNCERFIDLDIFVEALDSFEKLAQ